MRLKRGICLGVVAAGGTVAADLPIRDVTLYKHGIAFFERSGELKSGETVRLDFKPGDMNDVLKSLTITDRGGGKVAGVRYDASDPLENRLADFPFSVGAGASLASFLDQAKGARVELKLGAETVAGTVLSARVVKDDKAPEREILVLLLDSSDIRTFDLAAASTVRFPDPKLQGQLRDYLALLNQSRSKDRRSVYIDAAGTAARELHVSYMTPSAVWKSSYRLMFNAQGDPTLEGWAIVDNTSGEDWTNARLTVVSGKPVSFITQLYEPRYVQRPFAELAENRAANPLVYQGALEAAKAAPAAPPAAARATLGGNLVGGIAGAQGLRDAPLNGRQVDQLAQLSSFGDAASGREAGELFEYSFATPVTVKQGESAMLPFLQQKIGARKLLVYAESYGLNPRDAAELNNNTGKTLDGGPITVYDAGSYAGEALVETMPMGDKRLIGYGVDLGTRVTTAFDSSQAVVREVHVRRGVLTSRSAVVETKTYTMKNVDAKAKTLVIEHGQRPGYTLLDQKAAETTANAYRFEVKLAASGTEKFPVREERVFDQMTAVSSMTPDVLGSWIQNKTLSDSARGQLQQVATKKREIAVNDGAVRQAEADITATTQDESRMRSNIESLNRVTGQQEQVQQYARQLAAAEAKLATLRDTQSALQKKKGALDAELNSLVDKIEF
ncbi:MAG TPA: DUF4139 domain-containing protein [Bryobacteraceae bacterium]|nr:DUF4139 domain-containing protein [Bryobacteraceae bacterium]